jgi:predicted RNA-binding Zn ribbon-like protein
MLGGLPVPHREQRGELRSLAGPTERDRRQGEPARRADGLRQAALELREVFAAGDVAAAADTINGLLAGRAHPPRLTTHDGASGWHLHVDSSDDAPWGEWFLTSSCLALAVLLAERQAPPAGICASASCGRPFVNVGRGAARRYCSAACGTRERVAAHRAASRAARP